MKTRTLIAALAGALAIGAAQAQVTKDEYGVRKDGLEATLKSAQARCASLAGNAKDICQAEAKGEYDVAKKELEAAYKPTEKNRYDVRVAKAEAAYKVAREKCDDQAGNNKDVCMKEAKAAEARAKADAKAGKQVSQARMDAADTKIDAEYKVEIEKCDAFSGTAKDSCVSSAKMRYGKS